MVKDCPTTHISMERHLILATYCIWTFIKITYLVQPQGEFPISIRPHLVVKRHSTELDTPSLPLVAHTLLIMSKFVFIASIVLFSKYEYKLINIINLHKKRFDSYSVRAEDDRRADSLLCLSSYPSLSFSLTPSPSLALEYMGKARLRTRLHKGVHCLIVFFRYYTVGHFLIASEL